jgi:hypothetical protein
MSDEEQIMIGKMRKLVSGMESTLRVAEREGLTGERIASLLMKNDIMNDILTDGMDL